MRNQPPVRLIPVVDVMNGRVVRAAGGRRDRYEPITCPLTGSSQPRDIAASRLQQAAANELYLADLDAILGTPRVSAAVQKILEAHPVPTWLDAGIGRRLRVADLPALPHVRPVVGSETCGSPGVLARAVAEAAGRPLAFSLDLNDGRLLGDWNGWGLAGPRDVLSLAREAVAAGAGTLIVIDLARVGTGTGCGTEPLLRVIRNEFPLVELIAGGGVRTPGDLQAIANAGADAALIASALGEGWL